MFSSKQRENSNSMTWSMLFIVMASAKNIPNELYDVVNAIYHHDISKEYDELNFHSCALSV